FTSGEPALLPGGHLLVPTHGGRKRLSLGRPGERFRDFAQTAKETSAPACALGRDRVAFLLGIPPTQTIAVASFPAGQLLPQLPEVPTGLVKQLVGAPGGGDLYYAHAAPLGR